VKALPVPSELAELNTLITLAGAHSGAGRFKEAARAFEQASARLTELGRADTQRSGTVFNNWGAALIRAGRPMEAARVFRRSIEISMTDETGGGVQAMPLVNYARALFELDKPGQAQEYAERGLAKAKQTGDEGAVREGLLVLAGIYRAKGDLDRAESIVSQAALRFEHSLPARHRLFAVLALQKALNAEAAGDVGAAWNHLNEAMSIAEASVRVRGAHMLTPFLICRSGIALQLGRREAAQTDAARAIGILRDIDETEAPSGYLGRAYLALGRALDALGKQTDACAAFRISAEHLRNTFGPDHPDTRSAYERCNTDIDQVRLARR
jgi:tetratricopeptide (TPR) repeat protein